jgi:hypothetical protein
MTPIAASARIPNSFERFSEIAFGLIMKDFAIQPPKP